MNQKNKSIEYLLNRFAEAGLPHSRGWFWNMKSKGKLELPKKAWNTYEYDLTDKLIDEVIKSLKNKGEYVHKE